MVPVGHVMYELNQRMKAGQVSGYTHIKQLFADGIHLNNVGSYVVGCTYFATLYKQNPKGLPSAPYKVEDAKLAGIIQDVVWKVVSANKLAGVKNMTEKASPTKTAFKGWELYIWEEKGKTYFSLMFGTNRLKPREEIVKEAVKGIDAIKAKLDELKPGELVGIAGKEEGTTPPKAQSDQVLEYCKTLGLKAWRHQ